MRRAPGWVLGAGAPGSSGGPPIRPICPQPVGALLLEHCRVTQEEPNGFSISECGGWGYAGLDSPLHLSLPRNQVCCAGRG